MLLVSIWAEGLLAVSVLYVLRVIKFYGLFLLAPPAKFPCNKKSERKRFLYEVSRFSVKAKKQKLKELKNTKEVILLYQKIISRR